MANTPVEPSALDIGHVSLFLGLAFANAVQEELARAGFADLRFSHGFLIQHLVGAERTIGELAALLEVTQQAASKSVAELVELGYLERTSDPADRRVSRIRLSAQGRDMLETTRDLRDKVEKRLIAKLGAKKVAQARKALSEALETLGGAEAVRARRIRLPT